MEVNYWRCTLASNTNDAVTRTGLGVFLVQVGFERLQNFMSPKTDGADTVPAKKKKFAWKIFIFKRRGEAPPTSYVLPCIYICIYIYIYIYTLKFWAGRRLELAADLQHKFWVGHRPNIYKYMYACIIFCEYWAGHHPSFRHIPDIATKKQC